VRLSWVAAAGLLAATFPSTARSFECSRVPPAGPSLYWSDRIIPFAINQRGCDTIGDDSELDAIRVSFDTWALVDGSDVSFAERPLTSQVLAGYDWRDPSANENLMVWRHGDADDLVDRWRHEFGSIAVATTTFNSRTGELFDADIEFNSTRYEFTACTPPAPGCEVAYDVQNTATHEIGHLLGLDHTPAGQVAAEETTMYPSAPRGEVKKRDLDVDDAEGLRFIYPAGGPVGQCYPAAPPAGPAPTFTQVGRNADNGCWCGAGGSGGAAGGLIVLLWGLIRRIQAGPRSRPRV